MTPRGKIALAVALSLPLAGLLWFALYEHLPAPAMDRQAFALGCIGAALLLTLLPGIEAVAHERLFTPAIDPLAGKDSPRLIVNQRFVQNTLEQSAIFAAGLLLLAHYDSANAVAATAITWVLGRWAFWIGYHIAPVWRGLGVFSMFQSLVVLAYGAGCFAFELGGWPGVAVLIGPFAAIEAWLFLRLSRP
jgi:MAPEG family